ncbi:MAG: XrtA-associated ATPase [Desulfovibrio sp.]|uniref:XrtA/PEP-CTERM system-associated ATPase n=1 Tax=Desulfovibrio sp. TaxID=885 RepID=UPI002A364CAD|nr:XrtA/PEP-CTERM system-associated ATPase [Desulfovibrio sp.]MDY0260857.1 XrtA-associated ATPase [Desulfovibrio sp.]
MYKEFFGLREKPFDLLPNPDFLYPSKAHKRALTYLSHGIRERAGFILLTGEVGSGKTTLIRNMIRSELRDSVLAKVFNTRVDSLQLLMQINSDFGLETDGRDKAALLRELNDFLIEQYAQSRQAVLIIDEAQNLSSEILEEIRMLSNLETDRDKLLQIILVGQPQLREILARPELLQLRQRIQINCNLQPLSPAEVREYIEFRMEKAGNRSALTFDDAAVEAIATYSRGIPRLINILCDYIMIDAFSAEARHIDGKTVHELAGDLSFEAQYWDAKPAEQPGGGSAGLQPMLNGGVQPMINGVSGQAKVLAAIGALNKRVESLEFQPVWDNAALLDLRDRMDKMELQQRSMVQELWAGIQQLRSEISLKDAPVVGEEPASNKRSSVWKFLWGE